MRILVFLFLFCLVATDVAIAAGETPRIAEPQADAWISPIGRVHPLAGRIWLVGERRFLPPEELARRLAAADFVMLGEHHDNQDHHRLQAWAIAAMTAFGRRPDIAFEMITPDRQPAIDRWAEEHANDPDALGEAVDWAHGGWPAWEQYRPVFAAAIGAGLSIKAANLTPDMLRTIARRREVTPEIRARFHLDPAPDETTYAALAEEMRQSHCGMLPEQAVAGMIDAQRARDDAMASILLSGEDGRGAVLVAGAGHARRDRGVPAHLAPLSGPRSLFALAFVEVSPEETDPAAYAEIYGGETLPFDAVWFTPKASDEDPCAEMEAFAKKMSAPKAPSSAPGK